MCKKFKVDCSEPHLFVVHTTEGKTRRYVGVLTDSIEDSVNVTYRQLLQGRLKEAAGKHSEDELNINWKITIPLILVAYAALFFGSMKLFVYCFTKLDEKRQHAKLLANAKAVKEEKTEGEKADGKKEEEEVKKEEDKKDEPKEEKKKAKKAAKVDKKEQ